MGFHFENGKGGEVAWTGFVYPPCKLPGIEDLSEAGGEGEKSQT